MHHAKFLTISFLVILFVCMVLPGSAKADAGDKILRGSVSYVNPTADARMGGTGIEDFLDPARPPMGRFDVTSDHRIAADSNIGVGLDFELMVTDCIGINAAFNYSRQDVAADFAGQITFTPYLGHPPTLFPALNESASIVGAGGGQADLILLTVGANFHLLQNNRLDLYAGPVIGLAHISADLDSGGFIAAFPSFTSHTPMASGPWGGSSNHLALGGLVAFDAPIANKGWLVSTSFKYIPVENLNPWFVQVSLGHRF
jgi:hypothetical protein